MPKIIVGVDESQGSSDAIALATSLAAITGAQLTLVNVFPYDERPSRALNGGFEAYLRQMSQELLQRLRNTLGDDTIQIKSTANPSPAHGLHTLAEHDNADLIVVGSTHTGRAGRVLPGSTAERLLHGSPCPVAVAPKHHTQDAAPTIIGCGYDGTTAAHHALTAAHNTAATTAARLRVIRAFQPLTFDIPPDIAPGGSYNDALVDRASAELDDAVAAITTEPHAEKHFAVGDPAEILAHASEQLDLLFVGSRGYGPLHAVMTGGVSGRLLRQAACPVIVLPRTAGHTDNHTLFTTPTTLHA